MKEPIFIVEGGSDAMALITMGFDYVIGRASCNSGAEQIKSVLKKIKASRVIIVADNDSVKSGGIRPGIEGAKKLKKELGYNSIIIMTPSPIKDLRQMLNKVGAETARKIINSQVNSGIWRKE